LQSKLQNCHIITVIFMAYYLIMNKIKKFLYIFFVYYRIQYNTSCVCSDYLCLPVLHK